MQAKEYFFLAVPYLLWFFTFNSELLSFWIRISISTLLLFLLSLLRMKMYKVKLSLLHFLLGLVVGVLLYSFFWSGYQILKGNSEFSSQVSSVYSLGVQANNGSIVFLLVFPISTGEEFFWRAFVQGTVMKKISQRHSFILASLLYSSIHIFTLNPPLMFVALVGGIVWGYLYEKTNNILASLVSHVLFDEMIFVFLPFK